MSRKKKKDRHQQIPLSGVPQSPTPPRSIPGQNSVSPIMMNFDAMEDKIRGEEILLDQEHKKIKEAHELKKKLDKAEVDRRLEELRKQLRLPKK